MVTERWQELLSVLTDLDRKAPLALAYSGGLDSRFLAHASRAAGCRVLLLHAIGAHIPQRESHYAQDWARRNGLALRLVPVEVLKHPKVRMGDPLRCYHCKTLLLRTLRDVVGEEYSLCDGTNANDTQTHRPGLRALQEQGILSPLAQCGLSKEDLRHLGRETGLEAPEQKARPCLLTRFNYGLEVTESALACLEAAENALEDAGLADFRLRLAPEPVLQCLPLTIPEDTVRTILQAHGLGTASILEDENISGFFDRKSDK